MSSNRKHFPVERAIASGSSSSTDSIPLPAPSTSRVLLPRHATRSLSIQTNRPNGEEDSELDADGDTEDAEGEEEHQAPVKMEQRTAEHTPELQAEYMLQFPADPEASGSGTHHTEPDPRMKLDSILAYPHPHPFLPPSPLKNKQQGKRKRISKPKEATPEPGSLLSAFSCPICFSPPTNATVTPCGHVLCGACLFTAVKTTMKRTATMSADAVLPRCPVCRAVIPGWDGKGRGVVGLRAQVVHAL